ncbi:ParB-like protein [Geminisphaera colitermitum]|uniref:ParB-like protein n=1 Tax=Geminisphaera colitermitum TaxID=1148786 RepID=UPI000158C84B|nr:ParB-like protein [Geminisphaera colitermitum]
MRNQRHYLFLLGLPLIVLLCSVLRSGQGGETTYVPFHPDLPAGAAVTIDARRLHPTQFAVGFREVAFKTATIGALSPDKLVAYLKKKDTPVVIGPGGMPYMTDGHHTLRGLIDSRQPDKTAYGHILANWSSLSPDEFWRRMIEHRYTYLGSPDDGTPLPPAQLPTTLLDLRSNPWRGLMWAVMEAGGFEERKNVYFQEFLWADFFRGKLQWDDTDDADFARAVREAVILARSPEAAHLPGWKNP